MQFPSRYLCDLDRKFISDNAPIGVRIFAIKEGLRVDQRVYLQGCLSREGDQLVLSNGGKSKLVISSQPIEEQKSVNQRRGTFLCIVGSVLLGCGLYRFLYFCIFYKHFHKATVILSLPKFLQQLEPKHQKRAQTQGRSQAGGTPEERRVYNPPQQDAPEKKDSSSQTAGRDRRRRWELCCMSYHYR